MSTTPTEAHRELARNIMFWHTPKGSATAQGVRDAAQLIAESEARACDQLRDELAAARQRETIAIASWDEERNRALREGERVVEWRDRAERAEAELAKLQELHGCSSEMVLDWCERAAKRSLALYAVQSELAAERARLDWLENKGWLEKTTDGWLCGAMCRVGVSNKSARAAIDAAMKEDAK
jgi:hypothetical protein